MINRVRFLYEGCWTSFYELEKGLDILKLLDNKEIQSVHIEEEMNKDEFIEYMESFNS